MSPPSKRTSNKDAIMVNTFPLDVWAWPSGLEGEAPVMVKGIVEIRLGQAYRQ